MRLFRLLLLCLSSCAPAFAWGCQGHELVALTAWQFMSEHARQQVQQILTANPADASLRHFCGVVDKDLPIIAQAASWADDYRNVDRKTGPWHYIDAPIGKPMGDGMAYCGEGCVLTAVRDQVAVLKGGASPDQGNALRYVLHFVGDLHQPLHSGENGDQGGNCVPVQYLNVPVRAGNNDGFSPNLHSIWDTAIVLEAMHASMLRDDEVPRYSQRLIEMATKHREEWQQGTTLDWVVGAHEIADRVTYGELKSKEPAFELLRLPAGPEGIKRCSDNGYNKQLADLGLRIDYAYIDRAVPLVESQLAKAGLRLARVLNEIWP